MSASWRPIRAYRPHWRHQVYAAAFAVRRSPDLPPGDWWAHARPHLGADGEQSWWILALLPVEGLAVPGPWWDQTRPGRLRCGTLAGLGGVSAAQARRAITTRAGGLLDLLPVQVALTSPQHEPPGCEHADLFVDLVAAAVEQHAGVPVVRAENQLGALRQARPAEDPTSR